MHEDTIQLLGDCTAGIERAVAAMDGLLPEIRNRGLRLKVQESLRDHHRLHRRSLELLQQYGGREKSLTLMAKGMLRVKNSARMALFGDDMTAAYLVAEGCDAGIKSLSRSSNRYIGANAEAVEVARQLILCEEKLSAGLRPYL